MNPTSLWMNVRDEKVGDLSLRVFVIGDLPRQFERTHQMFIEPTRPPTQRRTTRSPG